MNLILLSLSDYVEGSSRVVLKGRRYRHISDVLRPSINDSLMVGLENGSLGQGKIQEFDTTHIVLDVVWNATPPEKLPVIVCCAMMRPIVFKRVLVTLTSLGVGEIHFFHSRRVEKSFWQSTSLKEAALREQIVLGLEQAKDTVLPQLYFHKRFKPFVEDVLPKLVENASQIVVADPGGQTLLSPYLKNGEKRVCPQFKAIVIGPEGGFIPYEVEKLKEVGCEVLSLGPRILKVETALVTLLAKLF